MTSLNAITLAEEILERSWTEVTRCGDFITDKVRSMQMHNCETLTDLFQNVTICSVIC